MKLTVYFVISAVMVANFACESSAIELGDQPAKVAGGGVSKQLNADLETSSKKEKTRKNVVWNPFWDYRMFGAGVFAWDIRNAPIVATGVLAEWNGTEGRAKIESVLQGNVDQESVRIIATGGIVRPKAGDKVILLLHEPQGGRLKLFSRCAASGLYHYSDDLAAFVRASGIGIGHRASLKGPREMPARVWCENSGAKRVICD